MWKSKKFIMVTLLAIVLLVGTTIGIVLAQEDTTDSSPTKATLLDRVAEKLDIEPQALKDAFAEVRGEMRVEALDNRLQKMVAEGEITQDEADQYKEWWQSRPDVKIPRSHKRGFGSWGSSKWH